MSRPFDAAPLLERVAQRYEVSAVTDLARLLGVNRGAIYKARRDGLAPERADEWAVRAGFHPCEVWSDWWEAAA